MFVKRLLDLPNLLKKKSFFLFGPRATGKSTLIRQQLSPEIPVINLLRSELYLQLSSQPQELEPIINSYSNHSQVIIDEVQRVPMLLNEVHRLIEEQGIHFLLTGSSARTLKAKHVNLLAGRAWEAHLFPFTSLEIPNFDLMRYLQYGGLPPVYLSDEPEEELQAYSNTYLRDEIQAESLVRKIPAFSRFLQTAALTSGQILNFTQIASDTSIPASTIREYYQILEDTFIGFLLPAWQKTIKRKALSTAKFYFFDVGVKHTLSQTKAIDPQSDIFGNAFEHFIILETRAYISYRRYNTSLSYWRSKHGQEVDLIIGDDIAIEIKSTKKITDKHLKGLCVLAEENICKRYIVISQDPIKKKYNNIETMPWQHYVELLWNDKLL